MIDLNTYVGSGAVVLGFITAVLGLANQRKIRKTDEKVQEVHILVNAQLHSVLDRVDQLTDSMHAQGAVVPRNTAEGTAQ